MPHGPWVATPSGTIRLQQTSSGQTGVTALAFSGLSAPASVARGAKFEAIISLAGSVATNLYWPYDAAPPTGVDGNAGISVDAVFTDPTGATWSVPAFYHQVYTYAVKDSHDWYLPTGTFRWGVRFTPHLAGSWTYYLRAQDRSGTVQTLPQPLTVTAAATRGFIRVSTADTRYFQFDDGSLFAGQGVQYDNSIGDPIQAATADYAAFAAQGVNFLRVWWSDVYGTAWFGWQGIAGRSAGNTPLITVEPFTDAGSGTTDFALRLTYPDSGFYGPEVVHPLNASVDGTTGTWLRNAVKPNTTYRLQVIYQASGITGPRNPSYPNYGVVGSLAYWENDAYQPYDPAHPAGTTRSVPVTSYGHDTPGAWTTLEGTFTTGATGTIWNDFLDTLHVSIQNCNAGAFVNIKAVSVKEVLGNGQYGPEILDVASMAAETYINEQKARRLDDALALAETAGVYLKVVLLEQTDRMWLKFDDAGGWLTGDNSDGFYGNPLSYRQVNKTRWLQQVWYRYAQARWGYSPAIHSWECCNEAEASNGTHLAQVDEMAKFLKARVFGVSVAATDSTPVTLSHPNRHLCTTSFTTGWLSSAFWNNSVFPAIDYDDLHAYTATSTPLVSAATAQAMRYDEPLYHTAMAAAIVGGRGNKPIVRGEAGFVPVDASGNGSTDDSTGLGIQADTAGIWLHNYLWACLDGQMYELYWHTNHVWRDGHDRRGQYRAPLAFLSDIPLQAGGYVDAAGTSTNTNLRVIGQKNLTAQRGHVWVQNKNHHWLNVVNNSVGAAQSGTITVPGLQASTVYNVIQYDTYAAGASILGTTQVTTDASGNLAISVSGLLTDTAYKIEIDAWPTLAANFKRTSAVKTEVRGQVGAAWYRPIEPYIHYKTQPICAAGKVFVATARGLYAYQASNGTLLWTHPTTLPCGTPTYANGRLYLPCHDKTIHCVDAATGTTHAGWSPALALAPFDTTPIVTATRVYCGNKDGLFYCLDADTGALVWTYTVGAPMRQTPAMDDAGILYFAAEDLYGYALQDAGSAATLVWKSTKLLGDSFGPYWAVIYRSYVIFQGAGGYHQCPVNTPSGTSPTSAVDKLVQADLDANASIIATSGTVAGDWASGTITHDASAYVSYFASKPHRRRCFILNRADGTEYTFGSGSYAPLLFNGVTQSGAKYPPVIGNDDVLYTQNATDTTSGQFVPPGALMGWKVGTAIVSRVMDWGTLNAQAGDEPNAYSIGGTLAYHNLCCDRIAGSFDLTLPFNQSSPTRWWKFWEYGGRFSLLPSYQPRYPAAENDGWERYRGIGDLNGYYGKHGAQSPFIPYNGRLYKLMGNCLVCFAVGSAVTTPLTETAQVGGAATPALPTKTQLRTRLEAEVTALIAAGHLKPAQWRGTLADHEVMGSGDGFWFDHGAAYFGGVGETIWALLRARGQVNASLQSQIDTYLASELTNFPPGTYTHVGFTQGTDRMAAVIRPETQNVYAAYPKTGSVGNNFPWFANQFTLYALWRYVVQNPGQASAMYTIAAAKVQTIPTNTFTTWATATNNMEGALQYLAGWYGYLRLAELTSNTGTGTYSTISSAYTTLLASLLAAWTTAYDDQSGAAGQNRDSLWQFGRRFCFLVPEIAAAIRASKLTETQAIFATMDIAVPYWWVASPDITCQEGTYDLLYNVMAVPARGWLLQEGYTTLVQYLDAPVFPLGDLFYLHTLVSCLEAS